VSSRFNDSPKPFVEHLDDLRKMLVGVLIAVGIGTLLAIPLCPWVIRALMKPIGDAGIDVDKFMGIIDIKDGVAVVLGTIGWTGLLISLPAVVTLLIRFIFPGLNARERHWVTVLGAASVVLFALGVAMGYVVTLPMAVPTLLGLVEWAGFHIPYLLAGGFIRLEIQLLAAFGLAFELPVLLVALGMMGIVDSALLRSKRRHVVVGIFILAMVLTPPDPITQVMMALPMILLYEACIWIIFLRERALKRR